MSGETALPLEERGAKEPLDEQIAGGEGVLVTEQLVRDSRGGGPKRVAASVSRALPPLLVFVLVLVAWQYLSPLVLRDYQLPRPTTIWSTFLTYRSTIVGDGWFTFWNEAFRGYLIGSSLGFLAALLSWRFEPLARGLIPNAAVSSSVPNVALAPALVAIAGSDWQSKVIICAIMTIFPMTINAYRGLRSPSAASRELLATYGAGDWTAFRKLHLPAALPFVFNALKINATLSVIGAIVAEYFGSPTQGLGLFIDNAGGDLNYALVWAGVAVACVVGIAFYGIVLVIERRLTFWHVSYRTPR